LVIWQRRGYKREFAFGRVVLLLFLYFVLRSTSVKQNTDRTFSCEAYFIACVSFVALYGATNDTQ
jgi:hypothetical protein